MREMWNGRYGLLLTEYFENKEKLQELLIAEKYAKRLESEELASIQKDIVSLKQKIIEFLCGLDEEHLRSLIYMSLNIDVEIGSPDKLNQ